MLALILSEESENTFCILGVAGEISTEPVEPSSVSQALAGPDGDQ